jgi:hypothetical protein
MKFKTLSAIAAVTLLIGGFQAANANNIGKGGGTLLGPRNFANFSTTCANAGDSASAGFANVSGLGETVQLQVSGKGIASASVKGLNTSTVTMLGGIQFYSDIPANQLSVHLNITLPGGTTFPYDFNLAQGSLQKASAPNLYFIGVNNAYGVRLINAGSRINQMTFNLIGNGSNTPVTEHIYGLSFVGFGGVGYDLTSPAAFCTSAVSAAQ